MNGDDAMQADDGNDNDGAYDGAYDDATAVDDAGHYSQDDAAQIHDSAKITTYNTTTYTIMA